VDTETIHGTGDVETLAVGLAKELRSECGCSGSVRCKRDVLERAKTELETGRVGTTRTLHIDSYNQNFIIDDFRDSHRPTQYKVEQFTLYFIIFIHMHTQNENETKHKKK